MSAGAPPMIRALVLSFVLLMSVCAMPGAAHAGDESAADAGARQLLEANIRVGSDGRLLDVQWQSFGESEKQDLVARVEPVLRGWRFQAGQHEGQPAETTSRLKMLLRAEPGADGQRAWRVERARTGMAMSGSFGPIRYPSEALRAGASAKVRVEAQVAPPGSVQVVRSAMTTSRATTRHRNVFLLTVAESLERLGFQFETVAGRPVGARVVVKIEFTTGAAGSRLGEPMLDNYTVDDWDVGLSIDSQTRLLTDVSQVVF
ncbi:hypothetical protein [Montanilutibacter psychrotolerans]|uniref:TonB C-terminal domain-containing protein n=1 Tax=Montanilutibacter psychrotolerans TaxID=1327343 RepID=A0A3M8SZZ2_9GAMM|nr:hypothetical protein [Lysobacter psychrotolerans]RNF84450.1 hypothetical protein EER27_08750 [Lysobacter psychrotolerans]